MSRLWVRVMRDHRINEQDAVPCAWGDQKQALEEALKGLDLPIPMWLNKHEREFDHFRRTSFSPDHFVESVNFEKVEIEYLDDTGKKRKSDDPRNQF
jgi:hypothetical protein